VEEIGAEGAEMGFDEVGVTPEEGVEGEIFFHADGGDGAGKLKGAEVSGLLEGGGAGAGADAEEREILALGVGDEVAAGVGDTVDFVEGIGEVGDAGVAHTVTVAFGC